MRRKPKILFLVAAGLFCVGLSLPLQAFCLYEHGLDEAVQALDKMTLLNWLVMIGCFACAALVYNASSTVRYAIPALISIVALNNFIVGHYATDFSFMTANLATAGFFLLNLPLAHPAVMETLRRPERRWWLMAPRRQIALPILLDSRAVSLRGETFDISSTGAFIPWAGLVSLKGDIPIRVCLNLSQYRQLRCYAKIVRRAKAAGKYPTGIAIQFEGMPWTQRWELTRYLATHRSTG